MNWKGKPTMHHTTTTRHDEKITLGSNKSCDDHAKTQKMRLKFEKYFLHIWSWCTPENWWVLCEYVFLIVRLISLFINATRLMGYYLLVLWLVEFVGVIFFFLQTSGGCIWSFACCLRLEPLQISTQTVATSWLRA